MNWTGKDKIVINAGNAGAVDLYWNDKSVGLMGKIGEVVDRTLTKDSDGGKAPASTPQPQQTSNAKASYTQEAPAPRYEEPAPAPQPEPAAPAVQPAPAEAVAPAAAPQANGVEIPKAQ